MSAVVMSKDFLRHYRGRGDDFDAFWRKFLVAGELQGWDTEAKKLKNLPLYLDGEAFLVWDELSTDEKKSQAAVKGRLQEAFSITPAQAYHQFINRTLLVGESVDAYG